MFQINYDQATESAAQTIQALTEEARGKLDEDNQSYWDMARGVMRAWSDLVGDAATAADRERLDFLIEDMPGFDDEGEGNWRLTPVVTL